MREQRRATAVAIWVEDLELAASFYRDVVGIPLEYSDAHPPENVPHYETMWGEFSAQGPVEPYLFFNIYCGLGRRTSSAHLSFPVPNLDEVHTRATARRYNVVTAPEPSPFGGRRAVYEDPDGNLVEVAER